MSECNHNCGSCSSDCKDRTQKQTDFREKPHKDAHIKKVIGIVSGKGGVGKSLVTSLLAVMANANNYKTAVLDADITGPSIPKAFGVNERPQGNENGLLPVYSQKGIALMSLNLLLESDTAPVIWRGPVIAGTVKQFWTDVAWGNIDFMFVDMPPGTGDVPLTVFQSLPVDGIVVVASPQELVGMIVEKAVNMANMMNIPVLALVENMSYFKCPNCEEKHYIFGESHIEQIAQKHNIDTVCKLPINPNLAKATDGGKIEDCIIEELKPISEKLSKML